LPKRAAKSNILNSIANKQIFKCNYFPMNLDIKNSSIDYLYSIEITPEIEMNSRMLLRNIIREILNKIKASLGEIVIQSGWNIWAFLDIG
jgi:hypothetical protein